MSERYNFKKITVVPTAKELVDIVLSKTQRKTPTVIHKHYEIVRIRGFYMRKIKFCHQSIYDKLTSILQEFPKIDELHPFQSDLLGNMYNKDHYKLALGQINIARKICSDVAKDYVRLMKFSVSAYQCKMLKKQAFGRMVKITKKQKANLEYLESVRQHVSRLPSIDPNTRTLLLCGFPNVGKSSFINKITRADVEVQPYAFTTKNLYVGHTDYEFQAYQVVDTPGILDHDLCEMNLIELNAITALSHLRAIIIYVMDLSEFSFTIEAQVNHYRSIRGMFKNKPVMVVLNKLDVVKPEDLTEEKQALLKELEEEGVQMLKMSTVTEEGVMNVRNEACKKLLEHRIQSKLNTARVEGVKNLVHIAQPKPRPGFVKPSIVHESTLVREPAAKKKKLQREIELEEGDDYHPNYRDEWQVEDQKVKHTNYPEIVGGKNVADFMDPLIVERTAKLLEEEKKREEMGVYSDPYFDSKDEKEEMGRWFDMKSTQKLHRIEHKDKKNANRSIMPRSKSLVDEERGRKRKRDVVEIDDEGRSQSRGLRSKSRSRTPAKGLLVTPRDKSGMRDATQVKKARKMHKVAQRDRNMHAKKGEGDRVIPNMMLKHMLSGKRGNGSTDRR